MINLTWLKRLILILITIRLLAALAFIGYLADVDAQPTTESICCATPADFGAVYEEVTITAVDNTPLSGWFIPSQNGATIIVLHGYGAHRAGRTMQQVEALATAGYGILTYDLRGHGQSGGELRTRGWQDMSDLESAIDYLQTRGDVDMERVGLFGFSVGAQIGLATAVHNPTLKAIMADGAGPANLTDIPTKQTPLAQLENWLSLHAFAWRTQQTPPAAIVDSIEQISPRSILLVQAGGELPTGEHYFVHANEPKELWIIEEASHGETFGLRPTEYAEKMLAFFDDALLEQ